MSSAVVIKRGIFDSLKSLNLFKVSPLPKKKKKKKKNTKKKTTTKKQHTLLLKKYLDSPS